MVVLRWLAKGEIDYPAQYCIRNGITLLWTERELRLLHRQKASRSPLLRQKKRNAGKYRR
jgi:hypothetical protein